MLVVLAPHKKCYERETWGLLESHGGELLFCSVVEPSSKHAILDLSVKFIPGLGMRRKKFPFVYYYYFYY